MLISKITTEINVKVKILNIVYNVFNVSISFFKNPNYRM